MTYSTFRGTERRANGQVSCPCPRLRSRLFHSVRAACRPLTHTFAMPVRSRAMSASVRDAPGDATTAIAPAYSPAMPMLLIEVKPAHL